MTERYRDSVAGAGQSNMRTESNEVYTKKDAYVGEAVAKGRVTGLIGNRHGFDVASPRWHIQHLEDAAKPLANLLAGRFDHDEDARYAEKCLAEAVMWATRRYR